MADIKQAAKWELVEDGYWKVIRYVQYPSGLIIGRVRGTNCQSNEAWSASLYGKGSGKHVGDYVTEALAKKAVEQGQPKRRGN